MIIQHIERGLRFVVVIVKIFLNIFEKNNRLKTSYGLPTNPKNETISPSYTKTILQYKNTRLIFAQYIRTIPASAEEQSLKISIK